VEDAAKTATEEPSINLREEDQGHPQTYALLETVEGDGTHNDEEV
jgi:hypothetical protein